MPLHPASFFAYMMLFVSSAFFSTNVIFGRALLTIEPFTLAFIRWALASIILMMFCRGQWAQMYRVYKANKVLILSCSFLAFWVCGGMVYYALHYTTASNGILIYTTPPILILAIEAVWRGRKISTREIIGISLAIIGAFIIVLHGRFANLTALQFNTGDLIFIAAAISWAIYSVLLKSKSLASLDTLPLLALLGVFGTIILTPFALYEILTIGGFPDTTREWTRVTGIVFLSSIAAFLTFQYGVKKLGSSIAGIFMYLLAPWGLFFAWLFLGENIERYHINGTIFILGGIIIATLPVQLLRRKT